jgi:hypothetical protein
MTGPRGSAASEQIVPGASNYAEALCVLAGCGEPLHIIWSSSSALYLSDTLDRLANATLVMTWTWQVECEAGHVVLLPQDTADDCYTFGLCTCKEDYPDPEIDAKCAHHDMERLRQVCLPEVKP